MCAEDTHGQFTMQKILSLIKFWGSCNLDSPSAEFDEVCSFSLPGLWWTPTEFECTIEMEECDDQQSWGRQEEGDNSEPTLSSSLRSVTQPDRVDLSCFKNVVTFIFSWHFLISERFGEETHFKIKDYKKKDSKPKTDNMKKGRNTIDAWHPGCKPQRIKTDRQKHAVLLLHHCVPWKHLGAMWSTTIWRLYKKT